MATTAIEKAQQLSENEKLWSEVWALAQNMVDWNDGTIDKADFIELAMEKFEIIRKPPS